MAGEYPAFLSVGLMKSFYEKILPSKGMYCITSISGSARNQFCENIDELLEIIERNKDETNVFFALSTFKDYSRRGENALYTRSFFVDLDVGEGKPYATKLAALAALQIFVSSVGLPPPAVVDSGNGVHAYWPLGEDIPTQIWKPYAEKFKAFCLANNLHIDPVVTADAARVLRCPETYNFKAQPPKPTLLLSWEDEEYSFEMFKEFLGEIEEQPSKLEILPYADAIDDGSLAVAKRDDDFEYVFSDIAINSLQGNGCKQIKKILEEAQTLPEPLWYAGLSVAIRCVDGATAIHDMSSDYKGYSREATIAKANQSLREATWAHGCDAFARENPAGCEGCPWRGKISSPIRLGRKLKAAPSQVEVKAEASEEAAAQEDPKAAYLFPESLKPFIRTKSGSVYYQPPDEKDAKGNSIPSDPVLVFEYDVIPFKRIIGSEGDTLVVRRTTPRDGEKEFYLPIHSIYITDVLKKLLPDNGVYPRPIALRQGYVSDYFFKWATYLQMEQEAEIMRMQMGWTDDNESFVFGMQEICKTGYKNSAVSPMVKNVSKLTKKEGTYKQWRISAQALNEEGWEQHAFGLLCGFGAPLMNYTPVSGATVCFMSADSGHGKTAALYAGLSVFCNPKEISVVEGNATANAYIGRYLALKNLMFGVDEVSNIDAEVLSRLIHNVSQGKAKLRMQSSVNAERELEQTASLIAFFTSNKDLYDVLRMYKGSPDGEMARLIQFRLRKPPLLITNPERGPEIIEPLRYNFGHAGPMFVEYILKQGSALIRERIAKWRKRWEADFSSKTEYRFYLAVLSATFAAGELANEAGIIDFDLDRIYRAVLLDVIQLRDNTVKLNATDYKALISDFINKYHTGFLIFNEGRTVLEPRNEIVGRIEASEDLIYISKTAFRRFLSQLQISGDEFEKAIEKDGLLVGRKKMRLSSGWKTGLRTPPIHTYVFKVDLPDDVIHADEPV